MILFDTQNNKERGEMFDVARFCIQKLTHTHTHKSHTKNKQKTIATTSNVPFVCSFICLYDICSVVVVVLKNKNKKQKKKSNGKW